MAEVVSLIDGWSMLIESFFSRLKGLHNWKRPLCLPDAKLLPTSAPLDCCVADRVYSIN